ncbi:MAG: phage head-tail adapter protein [Clostridiales bacterium]|nr:phage head-tail adapter protein [Clostridiales bacterium]
MNKEWSEQNKIMQALIGKRDTYEDGISALFKLRNDLTKTILSYKADLTREDFDAIPFINADGYHSKTIAYSLWHIFRIEDIVAHTLIKGDEQVFFAKGYKERIGSPIITTGNELVKQEIADFSEKLDLDELYSYIADVKESTERVIKELTFDDMKMKILQERRESLTALNVVSSDESAVWLIDYWCGKDIRGLIKMPFSRHWIMHIEACGRIKDKIKK